MNASHWPLFGFGCLAFVFVCVILAVAAFLMFRSGEKGTTKLGAPAGCLVGCALVLIALLAAFGVTLVMIGHVPNEMVRRGPVKSLEFELEPEPPESADVPPNVEPRDEHEAQKPLQRVAPDSKRARLTLELRDPGRAAEVSEQVTDWLRENVQGDIGVSIKTAETASGPRTRIEFALELNEDDMREIRKDLKLAWPGLKLPKKLKVEIKEPGD